MAWDYFADGKRIGGVVILDMLDATQSKHSTKYRVVCRRCRKESEMSHAQIMDRARKDREACMECRYEEQRQYPEPEGVRDLRGQFWPRIHGPMGPRYGYGHGTNQMIGQGASDAPI